MFLTIYHTDKGADTVAHQQFLLSHKLFYRLDQTLVYFRYSSEDMALVMLLFVDRFGIAFHSSLYPLEPGHAVLNISVASTRTHGHKVIKRVLPSRW